MTTARKYWLVSAGLMTCLAACSNHDDGEADDPIGEESAAGSGSTAVGGAGSDAAAGRGGSVASSGSGRGAGRGGSGAIAGQGGSGGRGGGGAAEAGAGEDGSGDAGSGGAGSGDQEPSTDCSVVVKDEDCDESKRPFVFVHGTYGSGDNAGNVALLFGSNGYCQDRFVAVEYNSLGGSPLAQLDSLIDEIRMKTGADQVELAGHSQGTSHATSYLSDAAHAAKVAHYINYSGRTMVPNGVKTLSLSSDNDIGGMPNHAPNAEQTITLTDIDHFGVAASTEAFVETWKYLYGEDPQYTEVQCGGESVTLEGITETFADNAPTQGGKLEIFDITSVNTRDGGEPIMTLTTDGTTGKVGPFELKRNVPYEFKGYDGQGNVLGRIYFGGFKRSNRLLRFLTPSQNPLVVVTTTGQVRIDPGHSALVFRFLGGAFRQDLGDSLKINGAEVLSEANAGRATSTVGLFMADQNTNMQSELGAAFSAPFIVGTDVYVPAEPPGWTEIDWNGTVLKIPNWPSNEGLQSVNLQ